MTEAYTDEKKPVFSVFVGNIPGAIAQEEVHALFAQVGPVLAWRPEHDNQNGAFKGYGYVDYDSAETATDAMRKLNGHALGAKQLRVFFERTAI